MMETALLSPDAGTPLRIVFDPHVGIAIGFLLLALFAAVVGLIHDIGRDLPRRR